MARLHGPCSLALVATLLAGASCTRPSAGDTVISQQSPGQAPRTTATNDKTLTESPASDPAVAGAPTSVEVSNLDDPSLAAVLQALHQRVAEEAQLTESLTKTKDVKRLAHDLGVFHTDAMTLNKGIFQRISLVPKDCDASKQIDADRVAAVAALRAMSGTKLDQSFLDDESHALGESIELFDRMVTIARTTELKGAITRDRPDLARSMQRVSRLQQALNPGVTSKQRPNP